MAGHPGQGEAQEAPTAANKVGGLPCAPVGERESRGTLYQDERREEVIRKTRVPKLSKMEDRENLKFRTGLVGIFQDLQLSSWPRVVTEQDLAGFCCEGKLSYHSGVTWNQNSQISLQLFQTGCLCSNVLSEHETQSKFKLSRVPQACKANPML